MRKLQDMLKPIIWESLPATWTTFNLAQFSKAMSLWDYQQEALKYALRALWKYYVDFDGSNVHESPVGEQKARFFQWYIDNGIDEREFQLSIDRNREIANLLTEFYPVENGRLSYEYMINRMNFWMATGSGKTLVIVKLIELLWRLGKLDAIPNHDILMLAHRDDLLEQFRQHIEDFNAAHVGELFIRLRELREYPEVKRGGVMQFRDEITVFFYRSDNISNEQKEKIIDFHNYDNNGHWYVLLDEAHKGDREDSKRQHIYSILSRNGFLFNFSATFTDARDVITTAYDFNLARFIQDGFGKHIGILKQENRAFRDKEDYTGDEKQKIVLKALIVQAYTRLMHLDMLEEAARNDAYHRPLMLTLVNSVNTKDADLKLFFRELERIASGELAPQLWQQAVDELRQELEQQPGLMYESLKFTPDHAVLRSITPQHILEHVLNATSPGSIEILVRPSNSQEIAFKVRTADQPFALIKIGDITKWLSTELAGYEVTQGFDDESYFENLNTDASTVNILMGSRTFYEGWDSNRPNVITFINIGTGTDARKFILQAVGRGVRIQPLRNKRRRLAELYNSGEIDEEIFRPLQKRALALETLFIIGTNRNALQTVIGQLDQQQDEQIAHRIELSVNEGNLPEQSLLIPVYRQSRDVLINERTPAKFEITSGEFDLLKSYVDYLADDRLLLAHHGISPRQSRHIRQTLKDASSYYNTSTTKRYGNLDVLMMRIAGYISLTMEQVDGLKPLEDEIRHFQQINVFLKDITELQKKVDRLRSLQPYDADNDEVLKQLAEQNKWQEVGRRVQEMAASSNSEDNFNFAGVTLEILHLANHYYVPVILSLDEKVDYIQHIIRHPSEVKFVKALASYAREGKGDVESFDWWMFSRLDESLDQVYVPYYDPDANRIRRFLPDFIFWFKKGDDYSIAFVDPKGMAHTGYQHKIDGYAQLFEANDGQVSFEYDGMNVSVSLFLYTDDANKAPEKYKKYWFDSPNQIFAQVLA